MASESVATNPSNYDSEPVEGNFTDCPSIHLWCANALSSVLSAPDATFDSWNDDIQAAVRYLLSCEVSRAQQAFRAYSDRVQAKQASVAGA